MQQNPWQLFFFGSQHWQHRSGGVVAELINQSKVKQIQASGGLAFGSRLRRIRWSTGEENSSVLELLNCLDQIHRILVFMYAPNACAKYNARFYIYRRDETMLPN